MKTKCHTSNCLQNIRYVVMGVLSIILFSGFLNPVQAQCPLACNDEIQVSVNAECKAEITPDMVLEAPGQGCNYVVVLFDENDNQLPDDTVRKAQVGTIVKAKVTLGANSCWSYIRVEDKTPPQVDCAAPDFAMCNDTSYVITPDVVTENCDDYEMYIASDKFIDYPCDSVYSGVRVICRYYVDAWGNISDTCCHEIFFERPQLGDIDIPADTIFNCNNFPGADPSITGVPTWNDVPLFPDRGVCEINISYKDDTLDICPESYKIIREWLIYDWCLPSSNGNPLLGYQLIKVLDEDGPEVYCPEKDIYRDTISSDIWTCTGTYILPIPNVLEPGDSVIDYSTVNIISECSEVTYTVSHIPADSPTNCQPGNGNPTQNNVSYDRNIGRWVATDLPHGCNWFYYTFTDECGNTSECSFDIYVIDDVPPVAVCDEHTIVSLGIDGFAKVFATSLDDGSWDNCEVDRMMARRMDEGKPCGNPDSTDFKEYVEFCCADEGLTRMVEFVVWDKSGNSNVCMVEVEVQDKMPPIVTCPPDITVSCDFDLSDLSVFGTLVNAKFNQVRNPIVIDDPYVEFSGPALDGEYYDNCIANFVVDEQNDVECGNGDIYRTFTVTDKNGRTAVCTQTITVVDYEPFTMHPGDWPNPYTSTTDCTTGFDLDPSNTGRPRIVDEDCGSVFVGHEDQTFTKEPDACLKVLRKWTVIDWCYYDPNYPNSPGIWTHTQVIKISNNVPPTITTDCDDKAFDLFGADCTESIQLTASATDDCTAEEDLRWTWEVDLNGDDVADVSGSGNDFEREYEPGTYRVWWTVLDQCNNESRCDYYFTVTDKKNPTPYCRTGINTVLMESVKTVTIWASDFNINSEDNCTAKEDLQYAFLINGQWESSMTFDCNDLGIQTIRMYVIDEEGNYEYCETTIDIQDPNDLCGGTSNLVSVGGGIQTALGQNVQGVNVSLIKMSNNITRQTTTNAQGGYTFSDVAKFASYRLDAQKNDDPLNGVSTKDLVIIQRYLLGMQPLANAYQHIAADANNNEDVTAADIAELRKLILGNLATFRYGQESWRFVDAKQTLDINDPFPYAEVMEHYDLASNQMSSDFRAVKIGDLDGDAKANATDNSTRGELEDYVLSIDNANFNNNETIEVPVYANDGDLLGMQITMDLGDNVLELIDVRSGQLEICDECYSVQENAMTLSWYNIESRYINENEPIFVLIFNTQSASSLDQTLAITSEITTAEAYSSIDDTKTVSLKVNGGLEETKEYALYQNVPNPFMSSTAIGFNVPNAQDVRLTIFDISGKVHKVLEGHFEKGYHEFVIHSDKLNVEGVLYYQLTAGTFTSTRKMLMLR